MQLKAKLTAFFSFSFLKFADKSQETNAGITCLQSLFYCTSILSFCYLLPIKYTFSTH